MFTIMEQALIERMILIDDICLTMGSKGRSASLRAPEPGR